MGQKINPNIFRFGITKIWKTEFFEKKSQELPLYTFKDLEIKNYIERFLARQNILLHDYKQQYCNSTLNLYISYFVLFDFVKTRNLSNIKFFVKSKRGDKKKVIANNCFENFIYENPSNLLSFQFNSCSNLYSIKNYVKSKYYQINLSKTNDETSTKIKGVFNNLFIVLGLFTQNKFNIRVKFCCLNKNLNFLKITQKKNFTLLQRFKSTPFLKESIELILYVIHTRASAKILAQFIASQVKKIKRHKFFLAFLKQILSILINSSFSKVRGVKILLKGRINGVPRAGHKIITIGDVPVQSFKIPIDFSQLDVHSATGTYGIKVWIVEK